MAPSPLAAGVDMATAEVRVTVADAGGRVVATAECGVPAPEHPRPGWSEQDARTWWPAVAGALRDATSGLEGPVVGVSIAATSGTVLLADGHGAPIGPAILYDDRRTRAPERWAWLLGQGGAADAAAHAWHASDLVAFRLTGDAPPTDWTSALKTGFDPELGRWTTEAPDPARRPEVVAPGSLAGTVSAAAAAETGLTPGCRVNAGMTDGCAAQVAAGADRPGRFVTVLGTTLVIKGATEARLDDPPSGIYSHRHPHGWWLPGGASNAGAGSLAARFAGRDLAELDRRAAERGPATVVCYPLTTRGERFPFSSDRAEEIWTGRPADEVDAYRAVLEGVAFVERLGYARLAELGAAVDSSLRSAGGGSRSPLWTAIRATVMDRPVVRSPSAHTAFGACVLAAVGTLHPDLTSAADAMVGRPGPPVDPVAGERSRLEESYGAFVDAIAEKGWLTWPG